MEGPGQVKALKFAGVHVLAIIAMVGFALGGGWMWLGGLCIWATATFMDHVLDEDHEGQGVEDGPVTDALLYAALPLGLGNVALFAAKVDTAGVFGLVGGVLTLGFLLGAFGTVVAHELIHRVHRKFDRLAGIAILGATFDTYFAYSHPWGHHRYVATKMDTSTARVGENAYQFAWRSATDSWAQGMEIGARFAKNRYGENAPIWRNPVVWQHVFSLPWLILALVCGGWLGLGLVVLAGLLGKLLLELVNYIEHYGITRQVGSKVEPYHSWNSAKFGSQYLLFNLSRHSDHHADSMKHYPTLVSDQDFPTLPHGYLTMIIVALFPPLYFKMMRDPLQRWNMAHG